MLFVRTGIALAVCCLSWVATGNPQTAGQTLAKPLYALWIEVSMLELIVNGDGFQSLEHVRITVELASGNREYQSTADASGRFSLNTGITVREIEAGVPDAVHNGVNFRIRADGDKGTRQAVSTGWIPSGASTPLVPTVANNQTEFPLTDGRFYTQASGVPGHGFAVTDEADIRFWSEFQRLGGVEGIGYPISRRFIWDGFVSQAFQKIVLQWRPEAGRVYAVNVIDLMHERGLDEWLRTHRATPPSADWSSDASRSWPEVVAVHQALLTDPDIRSAYFSSDDPITLYGLPMTPIQDMGNVLVLRAQRGIIQKWLVDTPWARAGQVTIANSGDVAREAGLLPGSVLIPVAP